MVEFELAALLNSRAPAAVQLALALGLRGRTTPRMPTHPVFDSSAVHGIRWPNDFDCEAEQRQWSGEQVWRDARDEPSTPKDARSALRM